ncbi:succinyl-coA:3-ketoacid coenzyme A transferase 1 [Physcia stellaris]|nr:succinyl-coA:3-ketoacid coenzyme A transferase 1 [Physcia stellaris]
MAKPLIQKHYTRILTLWPHDALRPTVSFQKALQHRIDNRLSPSPSTSSSNVVANEAQATVPTPKPFDHKGELEQVNALYSFLENRGWEGKAGARVRTGLGEKLKVEGGIGRETWWPRSWGLIIPG